ncbi:glycosyl transferase [Sphingobium sp. AR-3-1]|uniref:Glycosyl transferase n=1 Tax=Sphingobium psychrophilum TaxID=2728834 RepID=A0A7X9ZW50_9SPHN|nr:glycosyl transferase [Sphingobium psychrophilum]NML13044.1 glycosyl transferase [Sphingobium psychrophilum]
MGRDWFDRSDAAALAPPQRLCFFFNAQIHQLFHALPIAIELSRDPAFTVDIMAATDDHLALARDIAATRDAGPIRFLRCGGRWLDTLAGLTGGTIPPKLPALLAARRRLSHYDAIVLPERTSLLLKRLGLSRTRFIHTCHGAGDRAVGYDRRIAQFDFVLLAGEKQRRRMLDEGLIREGHYAITGYSKFDLTRPHGDSRHLFAQDRPVILYNPHFSPRLSSWPTMGEDVIRQFAQDNRFNLIVAPHIRLFDNRRKRAAMERRLADLARLPHVHIDLGSRASIDMRYVHMAALYLGDVSSQIYEYLARPRPCLFLNGHRADWQEDRSYGHWRYGPVLESAQGIADAAADAIASHTAYAETQRQGVARTFAQPTDAPGDAASVRAARALTHYLTRSQWGTRPALDGLPRLKLAAHV